MSNCTSSCCPTPRCPAYVSDRIPGNCNVPCLFSCDPPSTCAVSSLVISTCVDEPSKCVDEPLKCGRYPLTVCSKHRFQVNLVRHHQARPGESRQIPPSTATNSSAAARLQGYTTQSIAVVFLTLPSTATTPGPSCPIVVAMSHHTALLMSRYGHHISMPHTVPIFRPG